MDLSEARGSGERRHPWEAARAALVLRILETSCPLVGPCRVLDFGCGDGYTGLALREALPAVELCGVDPALDSARRDRLEAAHPGARFVTDLERLGPERFDVILALDVLEHVEGDLGLVRALVRDRLAPSGVLLVTVPAIPWLYGPHDRMLGHHRRYRGADLQRLLLSAGCAVPRRGPLFASLVPLRLLGNLLRAVPGAPAPRGIGVWTSGPRLTGALEAALRVEGRLLVAAARLGARFPGLSAWAVGRPRGLNEPSRR